MEDRRERECMHGENKKDNITTAMSHLLPSRMHTRMHRVRSCYLKLAVNILNVITNTANEVGLTMLPPATSAHTIAKLCIPSYLQ